MALLLHLRHYPFGEGKGRRRNAASTANEIEWQLAIYTFMDKPLYKHSISVTGRITVLPVDRKLGS